MVRSLRILGSSSDSLSLEEAAEPSGGGEDMLAKVNS